MPTHNPIGKIQLLGPCTSTIFPALAFEGRPVNAELPSSMDVSEGNGGSEIITVWFPLDEQLRETPSDVSPCAENRESEYHPAPNATDDLLWRRWNDDMSSILDEAYEAAYEAWVATGRNNSVVV